MPRYVARKLNADDLKENAAALRNALEGALSGVAQEAQKARLQRRACLIGLAVLVPLVVLLRWVEPGFYWIVGGFWGGVALLGCIDGWLASDRLTRLGKRCASWVSQCGFALEWTDPDPSGQRWARIRDSGWPVDEVPD